MRNKFATSRGNFARFESHGSKPNIAGALRACYAL
jgi:hypothetical protein